MFTFTRKADYALVAMSCLAQGYDACTAKNGEAGVIDSRMSARKIAETYDLPLPLLMNILKDLQKAKLLDSTRGAHGGYYLTSSPDQISVLQIIESIEGPVLLTQCCQSKEPGAGECECQVIDQCPVKNGLNRLHGAMVRFLENTSLKTLYSPECVPLGTSVTEHMQAGHVTANVIEPQEGVSV